MGLTEQQRCAVDAEGSVAVVAGAGTGKTHMLAERYLHFLKRGYSPLQIVAVTFTEKAAAELRSRIRQTIVAQLSHRPDVLAELEAAQISTFHALAARICREHPESAHVPPDFVLQDTIDGPMSQAEMLMEALAQLPEHLYESVPFSLMQSVLTALLADPLTAEQSLTRDRADWLPLAQATQQQALADLVGSGEWGHSRETLAAHSAPGDKLEVYRSDALAAISNLEQSHSIAQALDTLAALKVNVGSSQKWGGKENLVAVKESLKTLRDLAKSALKAGLVTLAPNEYDDQTEALLPAIRDAFNWVRSHLQQAKYQQRLLDFNDLEVCALKAIGQSVVQQYYTQRWQVFLIDEFQDTNPIQGQLLETLTAEAMLTIVGDAKQSIYGFRRADVSVFQNWQTRIHSPPSQPVALSLSFRTHRALMEQINRVFEPVLGHLHQSLEAHRQEIVEPEPTIQIYTVTVDDACANDNAIDTSIQACRRVEAQKIADMVEQMLATPMLVHDKPTGQLRPIQPGDIAILSRNWSPLELYGGAIAARNIPILQAGGGNLLDVREAKDAWALLQFLADPTDNLAMAAVLRSPFFALSDRLLFQFAQTLPEGTSWWQQLRQAAPDHFPDKLLQAADVLKQLLIARRTDPPTRLLQLSDRLTGYTAVIANLANAQRRLADWTGFNELVRSLEQGNNDVLNVVLRLRRIAASKVQIPRLPIDGENAVSLMTIHGSKGLEWPVVIVPDLSHKLNRDYPMLRFDADLGLALKLEDVDGNPQKSALFTLLEQKTWQAEAEESKRVLYVALTRARDQLILTAAGSHGGSLDVLSPGLAALGEPIEIPFSPTLAQPVTSSVAAVPSLPSLQLLHSGGAGFSELPVTALSDYALCPLRFKLRHVDGHPGYQSGNGTFQHGLELGRLTHKALELNLYHPEALSKQAPHLPRSVVTEAIELAQRFHQAEVYSAQRQQRLQWEQPISLTVGRLTLNGIVDVVGDDFILDFKTDQIISPQHHRFQVWAYSQALNKPNAYLAYLRHDHLHHFEKGALTELEQLAEALVLKLMDGEFTATPAPSSCNICPYSEMCDSRVVDA
ncbi:MAG: UvrD-helicase domain-containing protein [Cyanobacteria bacterium P01_D01_bin.56]